jgi:hypothetical protein
LTPDEFTLARRYAIYFPSLIRLDSPKTSTANNTNVERTPKSNADRTAIQQDEQRANTISDLFDPPEAYFSGLDPFSIDAFHADFEAYGATMV